MADEEEVTFPPDPAEEPSPPPPPARDVRGWGSPGAWGFAILLGWVLGLPSYDRTLDYVALVPQRDAGRTDSPWLDGIGATENLLMAVGALAAVAGFLASRRRRRSPLAPWSLDDGWVTIGVGLVLYLPISFMVSAAWVGSRVTTPLQHLLAVISGWTVVWLMLPVVILAGRRLTTGRGGLRWFLRGGSRWSVLGALTIVAVWLASWPVIQFVLGPEWVQAGDHAVPLPSRTGFIRIVDAIATLIWAPVLEEVVFRGVLYATLRRHFAVAPAALVAAAPFAAYHLYGLDGYVSTFVFAIVTALVYERTRSLAPCIIGHALTNLIVEAWNLALWPIE
ncbi:MAG: hypothetical protein CMJ83_21795 [Planctomycetes bacterium]|nr:hypothetical protein [Planctomycetota bacterium]